VLLLVLAVVAGCGRRAVVPGAEMVQRPFPEVGGRTVMVLPVQGAAPLVALPAAADPGVPPSLLSAEELAVLDGELGFWLAERAPRTRWVQPEAVARAVAGAPMLGVRPRELSVADFRRARLEQIGDPLYGELRRVGALTDARLALLPLGALWITEQTGLGRVHVSAALIDTFGGDVLWQGIVAGAPGARGDAAVIASTAQALAQLVPR
jgi:hypothetical protein